MLELRTAIREELLLEQHEEASRRIREAYQRRNTEGDGDYTVDQPYLDMLTAREVWPAILFLASKGLDAQAIAEAFGLIRKERLVVTINGRGQSYSLAPWDAKTIARMLNHPTPTNLDPPEHNGNASPRRKETLEDLARRFEGSDWELAEFLNAYKRKPRNGTQLWTEETAALLRKSAKGRR